MLRSCWKYHNRHDLLTENPDIKLPPESLYIYYFQGRVNRDNLPRDPNFLGDWEEGGDSFLFFCEPAPESVDHILHKQPDISLLDEYQVPYSEWQGEEIGILQVGDLKLIPLWEKYNPEVQNQQDVFFDPGVVFGTGNHATTRDCLEAMDHVFSRDRIFSALDIGSGSGLLSLAAAKLGSRKVLAVDNNPLAAWTTKKNIVVNQMQDKVLSIQARGEEQVHVHTDLLLANIHLDIMRRIVRDPGFKSKRWCILSGLMRSGAEEIRELVAKQDTQIVSSWISDEIWHTFLLKNYN